MAGHTTYLREPLEELLATVPVASEASVESEPCKRLGTGIEGLFRSELSAQWESWSPNSTTDGSVVHFCVRSGLHTVEVVGGTFIDFAGDQFPFRAQLGVDVVGIVTAQLFIGQVDGATGAPPRFASPITLLPAPAADGELRWDVIVRRLPVPIVWTNVIDWREPTAG